MSLVLSRETGLVSPQFHVAFDPSFGTVKDITPKSMWQTKAGFVTQRETIPRSNKQTTTNQVANHQRVEPGKSATTTNKKRKEVETNRSRFEKQERAPNTRGDKLQQQSGATAHRYLQTRLTNNKSRQ